MIRRTLRSVAIAAALFATGSCHAEPLTIDEVVEPGGMIAAKLSPDGSQIAAIVFTGLNHGLILIDVETLEAKTVISGKRVRDGFYTYNKTPRDVVWAGNDLLAVDYGMEAESVTLAGKKVKDIGEVVIGKAERQQPASPMLLVYTDAKDRDLALANARTGKLERFRYPGSGTPAKLAFDKHGQLRAVTMVNSPFWKDVSAVTNWYRPNAQAEWEKLAEFKVTDEYWLPLYVPDEANTLVISSRAGRDTYAVFSYDTQKRQLGEMMAGHPTQDILAVDGIDQSAFDRVVTSGMRPQQIWFDPAWAKVQATADAALPNRINQISGDPARRVLIHSYGDVDPGSWYVLDTVKNTMAKIASFKSAIDPARMRPMETISYAARDGLTIPAFLTRPDDRKEAAPVVVMIHGGPTVRDRWAWDADVQLLASRGYVVFQPQFRGSSGFGRKFEEAGLGQWGLAMQDDVTAGVEHLIKQGIADPRRICIYGASYGGYAAMWGLVKTPELYRCGISFAGVSDIEYMFNDSSDTSSDKVAREIMRVRIGDHKLDKEKFDLVSPLKHAARIKAPVLLMHGDEDQRVPISHGKKMKRALEASGKSVKWLEFEREGHGLVWVKNQYAFYETLLAFLQQHIGPETPKAAVQP